VKEKYLKQEKESNNDDKSMQLITSMTQSLGDKYSRILDKQAYEGIQKYDLIGVGVTLMPDSEKCIVVGAPPIAGSAAEKAGLKLNDYVLAINGISTTGRTAFDIIDQISENPTAKTVTMTIRSPPSPSDPPNEDSIRSVTMERSFAEVTNPVKYTLSETRSDGTKVGYIRIKEFNSLVKGKLEEALSDLEGKGANAYVLDIRHNPGGAFQSAVEISSLFLQDRVATYVVDSNKVELPFRIPSGRLLVNPEDPIAIWIDSGSASASEVLAGSLHDNCRAVVMGETSFGKGLVQAVYGLKNGAGLVLTVAKYITPDGTDIQGSGIKPDIPGHLPLALPPFLSSDTSQVDFRDVSKRLDACSVPPTHPEKSF
jgi:carboxyl-terminal processing protease